MLLRFVGSDGDFKLKNGCVYKCKIYTKKQYIWIQVRRYSSVFRSKYVRIPYRSLARMYAEWRFYDEKEGGDSYEN